MKRFFSLIVICIFLVGCSTQSPEEVLEEFYNYNEPGSESLDPLILAGRKMVPLVIEKIQDRNMKRRRLAMDFLGNGEYKEAIPVLVRILNDESEEDHFRVTALISIFQIEPSRGIEFARQYEKDTVLGKCSNDILSDKDCLHYRRTYLDALFRRHD